MRTAPAPTARANSRAHGVREFALAKFPAGGWGQLPSFAEGVGTAVFVCGAVSPGAVSSA